VRAFWNKNGKTGLIEPAPDVIKKSPPAEQMTPPVRLTLEELCCRFNPENLGFNTTANLPVKRFPIGQERAIKAIEFGLKIKAEVLMFLFRDWPVLVKIAQYFRN
jgi:hypothetical protein